MLEAPARDWTLDELATHAGASRATLVRLSQVRLLALTGMRLGEVLHLRYAEIDRRGRALRLGDTKSGASVRPLSVAALAVLDGVTTRADCPFAFPSPRGDGPYLGLRNAFRRMVSRKPELGGVTPHTLRHSFASAAAELGFTELTVAALIGHRTGTVTSRYVHQLDAVLLAATDRVAAQIEAWMRGNGTAEIVELSERSVAVAGSRSTGIVGHSATIVTIRP